MPVENNIYEINNKKDRLRNLSEETKRRHNIRELESTIDRTKIN